MRLIGSISHNSNLSPFSYQLFFETFQWFVGTLKALKTIR